MVNSLHIKYDDRAIMLLILLLIYSILYLFYTVLFGVLSYGFNLYVVCCVAMTCFIFSYLMAGNGSVKCVCVCVCVCMQLMEFYDLNCVSCMYLLPVGCHL